MDLFALVASTLRVLDWAGRRVKGSSGYCVGRRALGNVVQPRSLGEEVSRPGLFLLQGSVKTSMFVFLLRPRNLRVWWLQGQHKTPNSKP